LGRDNIPPQQRKLAKFAQHLLSKQQSGIRDDMAMRMSESIISALSSVEYFSIKRV